MSNPRVIDRDGHGDSSSTTAAGAEVQSRHLKGRMGTTAVVLTVLACLAPLTAVAGYVPIVIGYGNGTGAPLTFLMCGIVISVFAFGFLAMVRRVPRPGAFYAYVTAGLGKRFGLGAGMLTLTFYVISATSGYIFGAIALGSLVRRHLGIDMPWWVSVAIMFTIVGFCSYRGMDFNARALGIIVTLEILMIVIFSVVTLARGGKQGLSAEPFTWDAFTSGSIAVAALFAIAFFLGFESTAVYREEVRNPARTIPRATYLLIIIISLFYCVTSYLLIMALGPDEAVSTAAADPAGSFRIAASSMVGSTFADIVDILVVTSALVSSLALINATSRYLYSFGVDRVLPSALGAIHKKHGSPYRASVVANVISGSIILVLVLANVDPQIAYGIFSGASVYGFEVIIILVSLAVITYFRANRGTGESVWSTVIAPALTIIFFGWLLYYSISNAELLLGTPSPLAPILAGVLAASFVGGLILASWMAKHKSQDFERIGRTAG